MINIYPGNPNLWNLLKIIFICSYFLGSITLSTILLAPFLKKNAKKSMHATNNINHNKLQLLVGKNIDTNEDVLIPESGLYQNILITGTIGTGKTSSAMYPFTKQLIEYKNNNYKEKIGMLILDVKGNYFTKVKEYANLYNRLDDLIIIEPNGHFTYNPLDKPNLKPSVIANQLKNILLLFSPNNSESYWLDKAEAVLCEFIKFCRLYNDNYVTFEELHKLVISESYYHEKLDILHDSFINNKLSSTKLYDLLSCINFFEKDFFSLDSRTFNILKSEITRITNCFVSDLEIKHTFSPSRNSLTFKGFADVLKSGKIVVLNMNINEFKNLSKIIAAYLKLDFQTEIMSQLANGYSPSRISAFISDEYSEYVTLNDANFFSQSREAKCINIISTQSYTSLLNSLNNQNATKVIVQNLVNKFWFRTDDIFTIEDAQKQCGKVDKLRVSQTFSENAKHSSYNYLISKFCSKDSNISQSINQYEQFDYMYDTNYFTQNLETFTALCFLSNGTNILKPFKIRMFPYFLQ